MFLTIARTNFILIWDITGLKHCTLLILRISYLLIYNPNYQKQLQIKQLFVYSNLSSQIYMAFTVHSDYS